MPTDQEIAAVADRTKELLKDFEECQQLHDQLQRTREEFAAQFGLTAEEMSNKSRQIIDNIRQNGTPQQKAELARIEAEEKQKHEEAVARIRADVDYQIQTRRGGKRTHTRVRNTV